MLLPERFRPTPGRYLTITRVAIMLLGAIIVTGGAVRLTGSGLGCTDWPNCADGKLVAPWEFRPMVEFVNRLITGLVSAAVIAAVLGSLRRVPRRRDLTRWSWALVAGVVAQIVIGAFVTLSELRYSVVAVHFLVSMVLVWAAVVLEHKAADTVADDAALAGEPPPSRRQRWTTEAKALAAMGTAVLVSGAVVTSAGNHPGARVTHDGTEIVVQRLPFDLGQTVRVHSVLVWILCLTTLALAIRTRNDRGPAGHAIRLLLVAIVAQGAVGYVQYFTGVPALLVGVHLAGATLVWILTLRAGYATAQLPDGEPAPAGAGSEARAGAAASGSPAVGS